jgi:hypothetical protein
MATLDAAGDIACTRRAASGDSMTTTAHADRATDHPTREPADHANLDPRRTMKHPKVAPPPRPGKERRGRG